MSLDSLDPDSVCEESGDESTPPQRLTSWCCSPGNHTVSSTGLRGARCQSASTWNSTTSFSYFDINLLNFIQPQLPLLKNCNNRTSSSYRINKWIWCWKRQTEWSKSEKEGVEMCHVQTPIPYSECNRYVLKTWSTNRKNNRTSWDCCDD